VVSDARWIVAGDAAGRCNACGRHLRDLIVCLAALAASACTPPPQTEESRAQQEVIAACRQRADQVYLKQNRDLLSREDRIDSPLSSTGYDPLQTASLAGRYARDNLFDDCIRGSRPAAADAGSPGAAAGGVTPAGAVLTAAPKSAAPASPAEIPVGTPGGGPVNPVDLAAPPPP